MQTLFDQKTHKDILIRIDQLKENSKPIWGQMDVAQMVKHCQMPLLMACGKIQISDEVGFFKKMLLKLYKPIMYNDKPWPENVSTSKDYKITGHYDLNVEREQLKIIITEFHNKALNIYWPKHPFFGNFKTDEWGKMQYKHLDHHLRQFGV